ncbi:hypothetical protein [Streptomyces sp. NPDC005244]|uniref:hypothetical protein n=1 Tax=Streptomyces sp. NPDC005244 TaxID=3364708 RepID=UPI0036A82CA7
MTDQWYTVELQSGGTASGCGGHWPKDQADMLAEEAAAKTDETVLVVAHSRSVAAAYRRNVEITITRTEGGGDAQGT